MKSNRINREEVVLLERKGKKDKIGIWRDAARYLSAPGSTETQVNVGHLSRLQDGMAPILVPGKVLGNGTPDKSLVVGAFSFSSSAREKIISAGGEALTIQEFLKRYPEGSGVRLVK